MWRHIASNGVTFLAVALFLVGGLVLWGRSAYVAEGPLEQAICLQVASGSNMSRVSKSLGDQGAVASASLFRIGVDYSDKASDLKAGSFLIQPKASMSEIVDIITQGGASTCGTEIVYRIGINKMSVQVRETDTRFRVALAEGVTSWQVIDSLKSIDLLDGEVSELPAEGTLAPDSYEVTTGQNRNAIVDRMQAAQQQLLAEAWAARDPDLPLATPDEMLVLASIIEKETGVAEERRQVSSVFINRLNQGMKLQTDPTVIYGVTRGEGVLGRGLRQSELRAETPWNTYVIPALPPTPIANPGRASLMAAGDPDDTPYIFFVADGTGGHAFAVTLAEHNKNVATWRQIEADRSDN